MNVSRGRVAKLSELVVDVDLDFLGTYQVKGLAAPATGEALRKGNKDIANAEVANAAAILRSKLNFGDGLVNTDIAAAAAIALTKLASIPYLYSKVLYVTRVITAASGDVSYTGVGFQPTCLICFSDKSNALFACWGAVDSGSYERGINYEYTPKFSETDKLVAILTASGESQSAVLKTFDADGFTLTWTKAGSPTGTVITIAVLCLK